ncbi:MAG TPA: tRNA (N6-isopentenyl adenosine(37)-C2)-methylthiotransferase MiaB [Candidatus Moranbacteria bacterium]|nr:tRNA (N6-isopentenyl adenosine(37)-C2)-methylthiotransferase MiaB [Candidatus Moranbacteria bacterium]
MQYFVQTLGCQMNFSDSDRISSLLESNNFTLASRIDLADLVVFNTCGIRQSSEYRAFGLIHNLRKKNPNVFIVVTGCLAQRKDVLRKMEKKVNLFLPINKILNLPQLIKSNALDQKQNTYKPQEKSETNETESQELIEYLSINPKYSNREVAFVPIMTGCNNFCSYCVVPYARGREISRSPEEIFKEIENLAKRGYKKITLLGQNVNSYFYKPSSDFSTLESARVNFSILLDFLAKSFPKIIFGFISSHPKDFSEELMHVIAQNKNISREIHLPLQSGSDKILKAMNRPYTQKHYLGLVEKARQIITGAEFTTDVIVGFPGETEEDFLKTKKVFEKVNYNEAYINKYSPRPTASAYSLGDPIPLETKKKREKILRKLIKQKTTNLKN